MKIGSQLFIFIFICRWVWNTTIDSSKAKFLAPQGYEDLYGIAKRYKKKFPSLLGAKYSDDYYYVSEMFTCNSTYHFNMFSFSFRILKPKELRTALLLMYEGYSGTMSHWKAKNQIKQSG